MIRAMALAASLAVATAQDLHELTVPSHPFVSLEHVNINIPSLNETYRAFWEDGLGAVWDPRAIETNARTVASGGSMGGLVWANLGLQQVHMPTHEPDHPSQKVRGWIALDYASLDELKRRLDSIGVSYQALDDAGGAGAALLIRDPNGNEIRAAAQPPLSAAPAGGGGTWYGPREVISPADADGAVLPGGESVALGMRTVGFHVPIGAAPKICEFYSEMFQAGDSTVRLEDSVCSVRIGHHQSLVFEESAEEQEEYDGHHVAIYINDFLPSWRRFHDRGLVYHNPRFPQFSYRQESEVREHNEFRFISIVDLSTDERVYELEHEIRSLNHPGFSCRAWLTAREGAELGSGGAGGAGGAAAGGAGEGPEREL